MYNVGTKILRTIFEPLDRLFDWVYGSRLNPLYRSGTLAITLLLITLVTGLYLLIFYRLSAPYDSIIEINNQLWTGRWIRTLHRYASDLAAAVVIYHALRMISEGKTWGPRFLAWITGIVLFFFLFIVGWSGFVLVWDNFGQNLAVSGSKILGTIPLFHEIMSRTFSGASSIGSSFFFLNLFIHMSLPLGIIFVLWIHTSNLNKPAWFPRKKNLYIIISILTLFSIFWPAPLGEQADLLKIGGKIPLNLFYGFVIPVVKFFNSTPSFFIFLTLLLLFLFAPLYWRPKIINEPGKSKHNQAACTGCSQCFNDCPFNAIEMVPRTIGTGSDTVAFVDEASCVGCAICSASCSQLAIGPEDKSGRVQFQQVRELRSKNPRDSILFIHCTENALGSRLLTLPDHSKPKITEYKLECAGSLHTATVAFALGHFSGVFILSCPTNACINRLGQKLLEDRFLFGRDPQTKFDTERVKIFSGSTVEMEDAYSSLCEFSQKLGYSSSFKKTDKKFSNWLKRVVFTTGILATMAFFSALPYKESSMDSFLRVSIRLPGQAIEVCQERTSEELQKLPAHMRSAKSCTREALAYKLQVSIDSKFVIDEVITATGVRGDKPLLANYELNISPGLHAVSVSFTPTNSQAANALSLKEEFSDNFEPQRVMLVGFNATEKKLFHTKTAVK